MVNGVAAARLELCSSAPGHRQGRLLDRQARARKANSASASAPVQANRSAEEHRDRLCECLLCCGYRLCADLAHLVDGRSRHLRRLRDIPRVRISRAGRGRDIRRYHRPIRSRSSRGGRAMSVAVADYDLKQETFASASEAGPAPKRTVVAFGFWVFLLSDIVMFSALFAAYAVLVRATAGGPTGAELFNQVNVAVQTGCLLLSSYTCGLMSLAVSQRRRTDTYLFALVTFVLGAAFLYLELHEFAGMIARGAGPKRSPFLSEFFTLRGCHVCAHRARLT